MCCMSQARNLSARSKLRAVRLDVPQDNISLVAESDVDEICGLIESMKPDLVVIDSIQIDALY
mgnify:CR=1 FL=1